MVKLALVSTFPPAQCGIGNYSRELVGALRGASDLEVSVIAERASAADDAAAVYRAWDRRGDWSTEVLRAVDELRPDVVHVQHEEAIFGNRRLPPFLRALRERGIATVITLHTVHERWPFAWFHGELARSCDRIIAHQRSGMASVLEAQGVPREQVEVIAHGTPRFELPSETAARDTLELPRNVPIALFFGFIHRGKGLHVAVDAFEGVHEQFPDARFVIAGRIRQNHVFDKMYATQLQRRMAKGIAAGRIIFRPGFVPAELKRSYFAAANMIVLPHHQAYGSASGVLHEAIAARRAILCTRGKKFAEAVEAFATDMPELFPAAGNVEAWQEGFAHLLGSRDNRVRASALISQLVDATSWSVSGERHAQVYRTLAEKRARAPHAATARYASGVHVAVRS